jgi:hypothetical protein
MQALAHLPEAQRSDQDRGRSEDGHKETPREACA